MIIMRLERLVDTKCDKLAVNFCQKALQAIRASGPSEVLQTSVTTGNYQRLLRNWLALLVKLKQFDTMKSILESMSDEDISDFLRFSRDAELSQRTAEITQQSLPLPLATPATKRSTEHRLLKNLSRVNQIALHLYIIRLLRMDPFDEELNRNILLHYLTLWISDYSDKEDFDTLFKDLLKNAATSRQSFIACDALIIEVY